MQTSPTTANSASTPIASTLSVPIDDARREGLITAAQRKVAEASKWEVEAAGPVAEYRRVSTKVAKLKEALPILEAFKTASELVRSRAQGAPPDLALIREFAQRLGGILDQAEGLSARIELEKAILEQIGIALKAFANSPNAFGSVELQQIGVMKLQAEALPGYISKLESEFTGIVLKVPLLLLTLQPELGGLRSLVSRGRGEIAARTSVDKCKQEARQKAWRSSEVLAIRFRHVGRLPKAPGGSDLVAYAREIQRDAIWLIGQMTEIIEVLGTPIPTKDEFEGNVCSCGCGRPVEGTPVNRFWI